MTALCQPLPLSVVGDMLQVAVRALCDRPEDSQPQREARTHQMVLTTFGLAPRDGLEFMLATLAFGHFQLILDSISDVFHGQADALKAKTKSTIIPLGRTMLEMLRELRQVQLRPVIGSAEAAIREATAETSPPQTAATEAAARPPPDPGPPEPESGTVADPRPSLPEEVVARLAGAAPSGAEPALPEPAVHGATETTPAAAVPGDRIAAVKVLAARLPVPPDAEQAAWEDPSKSLDEHIVSYHETLAAMLETVTQQQAQNAAREKVASGDQGAIV